jgi:cytochrome c biogenesis protein CcmG/thiol:disulfide interchange protein DsbE
MLAPLLIFAAIAGMFAFALQKGDPSKLPSALIGKPAPRLELAPVEGLSEGGAPMPGLKAGDLGNGTPAVVNFFASWCAPCVEEHPMLIELSQRGDVPVIGINYKDQAANARRFLARYGNPFQRVGADTQGRAAIEWGVYGMPETFVVDGRGMIVFKHVGPITPEVLKGRIVPAIERAKGAK